MRILFEHHPYQSSDVERELQGIYDLQDVEKRISISYVGYFYNPDIEDCVFILPKVLLKDENEDVDGKDTKIEVIAGVPKKENGKYVRPEDIITPEGQEKHLQPEYRKFIYEFAVWIYRALDVYRKANPKTQAIYYRTLPEAGRGRRHSAKTFLDIVLSLVRCNEEHQNFFLFTIKNLHSGHYKINWTRTITRTPAIVQGNNVIYLNPVNKKKVVNFDEELFVIFFSILNYLNEQFGFRTPINVQYNIINGRQFERYKEGYGKKRLQQIHYKYFSDKALELWDLCMAFFESAHKIAINTTQKEYLLAKKFEIIFEAMIDELIGIPHNQIPKGLADQDDGKRVDHMYTDLALTSIDAQSKREVYYIGDSKYYKSGHSLTSESIYKQYTYARNVVQWNINLFLDNAFDEEDKKKRDDDKIRFKNIRLQDVSETEGYDVIPNFFISAFVYDDHRYIDSQNNIKKHTDRKDKHCTKVSYQFPDRLFDRDTLFLSQYDVNFLYVLYLYARDKVYEKAQWKKHVRDIFREEIRSVIQEQYKIYAMRARLGVDGSLYLRQHFYELNGRVFQPYGEGREIFYAYARPIERLKETETQFNELEKAFVIKECSMGNDPKDVLEKSLEKELQKPVNSPQWLTMHYLERDPSRGVLVGYYKDEEHLKWILGNNDKGSLVYNVRLEVKGEDTRVGAHTAYFYEKKNIQFVILYTDGVENTGEYRVFHVRDTASKVTEERMSKTWYPFEVKGSYFFFRFDEEVNIGKLRITELIEHLKQKHFKEYGSYTQHEPLFSTAGEVLDYKGIIL